MKTNVNDFEVTETTGNYNIYSNDKRVTVDNELIIEKDTKEKKVSFYGVVGKVLIVKSEKVNFKNMMLKKGMKGEVISHTSSKNSPSSEIIWYGDGKEKTIFKLLDKSILEFFENDSIDFAENVITPSEPIFNINDIVESIPSKEQGIIDTRKYNYLIDSWEYGARKFNTLFEGIIDHLSEVEKDLILIKNIEFPIEHKNVKFKVTIEKM